MSGGSLDYFFGRLEDHIGDFKDIELDDLVRDLAKLFHDREWYLSCDISKGEWRESRDEFKKKWFTEHGRQERIEKYLDTLTDEIREQLGLNDKYCDCCKHWKREDDYYGKCEYVDGCSYHRKEWCEEWEKKE